jgi:PilZ domain
VGAAYLKRYMNSESDRKRKAKRIETFMPVDFVIDYDALFHHGRATNVSRTGLFLRAPELLDPGTQFSVAVPVVSPDSPFGESRIILDAKVVHTRTAAETTKGQPMGMGVTFPELGTQNWRAILRTLSSTTFDDEEDQDDEKKEFKLLEDSLGDFKREAAEFFQDLSIEIDPDTASKDVTVDRRDERIITKILAKIQTAQGEAFVQVVNISKSGIGFIGKTLVNEGDTLEIALSVTGMSVFLRGRIARRKLMRTVGSPQYSYGMMLDETRDSYTKLMDSLRESGPSA